jgi:selenide,water dikinase
MPGVHALTDVTGFGLLGHLLEVCRASAAGATIAVSDIPLLPDAASLAAGGFVTGASARNWASYGDEVDGELDQTTRAILTDPQTSGGLLVACSTDAVDGVLRAFRADGFESASVIGHVVAGPSRIAVQTGPASVAARNEVSVA